MAKFVAERKPGWFAVAVAMVQVRVEPEAPIESPLFPEVANVYAVWERVVPAAEMVVVVNPVTVSKAKPEAAVEETTSTLPAVPVIVAKALVPEAIRTPLVKVPAPVPPLATVRSLVRVRVPTWRVVPVAAVKFRLVVVAFVIVAVDTEAFQLIVTAPVEPETAILEPAAVDDT